MRIGGAGNPEFLRAPKFGVVVANRLVVNDAGDFLVMSGAEAFCDARCVVRADGNADAFACEFFRR